VRDSLFQRGAYTHGVVLGLERPDSANRYGWIYYRKSFYVRRHLPQLGENRGFDRRQDKPFRGALKNPSIYRYNNTLAGELLALKMNIAASDVGITPATFGDLKFMDPANPGDVLNGLNLRQITARVDSVMTLWEWFPGVNYDALSASLRKINRSFAGPMDTVSLRPMKLEPVAALFTKNFLVPNTAPPAELPPYVPLDSFEETPASFALMQNFPNPFNPYTTIEFEIPAVSSVDLKVYDLTGREVAALLEEALLDDGTHAVEFDASQLSTGVYFYRLGVRPVGEGEKPLSTVRKMMLIK
jgi:hypothetical protein